MPTMTEAGVVSVMQMEKLCSVLFAADLVINNTPLIHFTLLLSLVVKLQAFNAWLKDKLLGRDSHTKLLTSISSSVLNDSLDIREKPEIEL